MATVRRGYGRWHLDLHARQHRSRQALAAGQTLQDSFPVTSQDGTDTQRVTITITGATSG